ncbi:MAG: sugar phosphate isomerase/epimerase [Cyclobacteriaceae bacterium]|nr:sugar phosphate isomerase/epimerase [Cyclobacteriaceae bacterium]
MKRRDFMGRAALLAGTLALPVSLSRAASQKLMATRDFGGVRIGVITYSFRSMPSTIDDLLGYLVDLELETVELMGGPVEAFAGAPEGPPFQRPPLSEAQQAERKAHAEELRKWRASASMDKFKQLRKKFDDEGVAIDIVKFPLDRMSEEELAYAFNVAHTLGATGITLERSDEAVKKLAPYADKYKTRIGYHNHAEVNFNSWNKALTYSPYNFINLDVGHYVAGTNESPIPLIKKYHDRILNLHLKDRKKDNGDNVPWGQGDTPLRDILRLMKAEKYTFMGTIELEYPIPEGSDAVKEVRKCIDFCKESLA